MPDDVKERHIWLILKRLKECILDLRPIAAYINMIWHTMMSLVVIAGTVIEQAPSVGPQHILCHLEDHKMLTDLQHGFRSRRSCRAPLITSWRPNGGWRDIWMCKELFYLWYTLDGDDSVILASAARIRNGWMKFREILPFLTSRAPPLDMKDRVYASYARSSMTYGSETRPLLVDFGLQFERAEMQMIRWMCGVFTKDKWRIGNAGWSWAYHKHH